LALELLAGCFRGFRAVDPGVEQDQRDPGHQGDDGQQHALRENTDYSEQQERRYGEPAKRIDTAEPRSAARGLPGVRRHGNTCVRGEPRFCS
jgi:hypothetical protein